MMQATLVTHGSEQEGRQKIQHWMLFLNMSTGVIWGSHGGGIPKPKKYHTNTSQESLDVLVFQAHWRPWTAPMPSTLGALARRFENHFGRQPEQKALPEVRFRRPKRF